MVGKPPGEREGEGGIGRDINEVPSPDWQLCHLLLRLGRLETRPEEPHRLPIGRLPVLMDPKACLF